MTEQRCQYHAVEPTTLGTAADQPKPPEPPAGGRRALPLVAVSLGYFMVILDATIVTVALPALGRDLGSGVAGLQWVVDAYTATLAGLLLLGGSLATAWAAARSSRRRWPGSRSPRWRAGWLPRWAG
jgi:DHA2 family methylenomycin A resistance protein-like MFS transporter